VPKQRTTFDGGSSALDAALTAIVALLFLASAVFPVERLPQVDVCQFHRVTGLPCPGCGLTRAACSLSHGQWAQAWAYNPFVFLFYGLGLVILFRPVWRRTWPGLEPRVTLSPWFSRGAIGLVGAMMIFGAWRILRALGLR
jgi:hypothetical protein